MQNILQGVICGGQSQKKSYVGCFTAVDRLTLILSSCFNPGLTSAHARLLLLKRNENDFLTVYNPVEKENSSVGSSAAKELAKKLNIRSVMISTTQTIKEKNVCIYTWKKQSI